MTPPATYPKTYATVTGLFPPAGEGDSPPWPDWVIARTDDGRIVSLRMGWKNGGRSSTLVRTGRRIKIYQRPGVDHLNFRMVGD